MTNALRLNKFPHYNQLNIIVSDAGNGEVSDKWVFNPLITLKRTSEVFMQRIKKIQIQQNLFIKSHPEKRFAYALLEWDVNERMLKGFMGHLHNHVGLTENFDQSENEEFLVNDSP